MMSAPDQEPHKTNRRRGAAWRREGGAALLSVLLIVTLMSAVAISVTDDIRFALRRMNATHLRDQTQWYALGAETFVKEVIARSWELDRQRSTMQSPWAVGEATFPIDNGLIQGRIRDASNCFNLNSVVTENEPGRRTPDAEAVSEYITLLSELDIAEGEEEELAHALVDWVDDDGERFGRGAEDVEYSVLKPPYRPANALISDVLELRAVAGYEEDIIRALRPYVCAHPTVDSSRLNINTLTVEQAVLMAVAINDESFSLAGAVSVIEQRPEEGFAADLADALALDEFQNLSEPAKERAELRLRGQTQYFNANARVFHHEAYVEINALLELDSAGNVTVLQRRFGERDS